MEAVDAAAIKAGMRMETGAETSAADDGAVAGTFTAAGCDGLMLLKLSRRLEGSSKLAAARSVAVPAAAHAAAPRHLATRRPRASRR